MDLSTLTTEQLEQELANRVAIKKDNNILELAKIAGKANPLKAKVKTLVKVNYGDLENFVKNTFGVILESAVVEEMSNDTNKEYSFIGHGGDMFRNDGSDNKNVEDFLFGRKHHLDNYSLNALLEWLAVREFIPVGDYLVEFSW